MALALVVLVGLHGAAPAAAQESAASDPLPADLALASVAQAFDRVGDRAAAGAWQDADGAFNDALDALDAARPALEAEQGEAATRALAEVDRFLDALDVALRAEDPTRVRAAIAGIKTALSPLAPGSGLAAASGDAVATALAWRDALVGLLALGDAGEWIPMRNAALDLHADILARKDAVATAAGPAGASAIERLRIFTMRLFVASLDQSPEAAADAARFYREAMDELLVAIDVLPADEAEASSPSGGLRFRAFQVVDRPGEIVSMPLKAEGIPPVGLGSFELALRWSPRAIRLLDVSWETGQGSLRRDDGAGRAVLRFPQAPTGPSGDALLASLQLEVLDTRYDPRDYLPRAEIEAMESSIDAARDEIRRSNVPAAAQILTDAYVRLLDGRRIPGSLYSALEQLELADAFSSSLLELVDLSSQPSISSESTVPIDLLVQLLSNLESSLDASLELAAQQLAPSGGVPVVVELLSVTDTSGQPLPFAEAINGVVLPAGAAEALVERPTAGDSDGEALPTIPPELVEVAGEAPVGTGVMTGSLASQAAAGDSPGGAGRAAGKAIPPAMILALLLALIAGGAAVAASMRSSEGEAQED